MVNAKTFAAYCQQRMGIPIPSGKNCAVLNKHAKALFDQYPNASWQTLVRTLDWCIGHNRRYAEAYGIVTAVRYAWRDGYLPELDPQKPVDEKLEHQIESALKVEDNEDWRYRLLTSSGIDARRRVFEAWRTERTVSGGR